MNIPKEIQNLESFLLIQPYKMGILGTIETKVIANVAASASHAKDFLFSGDFVEGGKGFAVGLIDAGKGVVDVLSDANPVDEVLLDELDNIFLPLPNNIKESMSQKYEESIINLEERMARTAFAGAKKAVGMVSENMSGGMDSMLDLAEHLARRGNLSIDPNTLMVYGGSVPRTVSFDFILNPTSQEQSKYYNECVNKLKLYSLSQRRLNSFYGDIGIRTLSIPTCFIFKAINNKGNDLFAINSILNSTKHRNQTGGFYLSNINLNIGGHDSLQLYWDGSAKSVTLTLSFVERQPLWKDDWKFILEEYNSKVG